MNKLSNYENLSFFAKLALLASMIKPVRFLMISHFCLAFLVSCWWPAVGLLVKYLLDEASRYAVGKSATTALAYLTLSILVANLLGILLYRLLDVVWYRKDQAVKRVLIIQLTEIALQKNSTPAEMESFASFITNRIIVVADNLLTVINTILGFIFTTFLQIFMTLIICWRINIAITTLLIAFLLIVIATLVWRAKWMEQVSGEAAAAWAHVTKVISKAILAKNFKTTADAAVPSKITTSCQDAEAAGIYAGWQLFKVYAFLQGLLWVIGAGILFTLFWSFSCSKITIGDFAFLQNNLTFFFYLFWALPQNISTIINAWGNATNGLAMIIE